MLLKRIRPWIVVIGSVLSPDYPCFMRRLPTRSRVCVRVFWRTQFAVGMQGTATSTPPGQTPLPVRVKISTGSSASILVQLRDGDLFTVIGSSVCKDGYLWWQVTSGAALTNDPGMIIRLLACSNAMFFITQPINGGTATLFSAPLSDLSTHTAALTSDTALSFVGCVPG